MSDIEDSVIGLMTLQVIGNDEEIYKVKNYLESQNISVKEEILC